MRKKRAEMNASRGVTPPSEVSHTGESISARPDRKERLFLGVLTLFVLAFLFWVVTTYNINQLNSEVAQRMLPSILANGNDFVWNDLLKSFDFNTSDGMCRTRFVSYALQIVNIKFRMWLWRFMPPHPSLSLVWLFILFLTPLFLYKFVRILTGKVLVSWITVLLFVVSAGSLSGIMQLFHPGKPLTNFWTVVCLYLAARIAQGLEQTGRMSTAMWFRYAILLVLMLAAFFTDELGFFIPVAIVVLVPGLLFRQPETWHWRDLLRWRFLRWPMACLYILPALAFLILVNHVVPVITTKLGYGPFDFWSAIHGRDISGHLDWRSFLAGFSQNGFHLVANHIMPMRELSGATPQVLFAGPPIRNFFSVDVYVYLLAGIYVYHACRITPATDWPVLKRAACVLPIFLMFLTRLFSGDPVAFSPFYYGATFSVYFSLVVALILSVQVGWHGLLNKAFLAAMVMLFAANSLLINRAMNEHIDSNYRGVYGKWVADMPQEKIVTRDKIERLWRDQREKKATALTGKQELPARAFWLFVELDYLRETAEDKR
jgi:hypothetical protein